MERKPRRPGSGKSLWILFLAWLASACQTAPPDEDCEVAGAEDDAGLTERNDPACAGALARRPRCGNGQLEAGEVCDDGNRISGDGCDNDCTSSVLSYLKASNTGAGDIFGWSIALSADGSTLAVGAREEESAATGIGGDQADDALWGAGAVYVFARAGTTWIQQAYLKASNTGAGDAFGMSVALSADGSTLAVGAHWEDSAATGSGDGSTLAVGAMGEASAAIGVGGDPSDNSAAYAGAVYVLTRSGTTWSPPAYVKASNTDGIDYFGENVALSGDASILAVSARNEDSAATGIGGDQADDSALFAGAVYVYH